MSTCGSLALSCFTLSKCLWHCPKQFELCYRQHSLWSAFSFFGFLMCILVSQHRFAIFLMSDGFKHPIPCSFAALTTLWITICLNILSLLLFLLLSFKIPFSILDSVLNHALFHKCFLLACELLLFISLMIFLMRLLCLKRPVSLCCLNWPWTPQPLNSYDYRHTPLHLAIETFCCYLLILCVCDKISHTPGLTLSLLYS